ncbi:MAG: cation-efflux pump, partial [Thermoguttaceae bacterium]
MGDAHAAEHRIAANREKGLVALSSLLAAVVLTLLKLLVGLSTHSLGILAEAAHSALDLVAAAVTLWAVRISGLPADQEHTYGHGKFENLSALFETILLLLTCVGIAYEAARRLLFGQQAEVDASGAAFLVVLFSMVVDFSRSRALRKVSEKYQSQALEADALHFSTDIWSSGVVLLGLLGVRLAKDFQLPWLGSADTLAALGVAAVIVWVSLKLGKKSVDDLLDRVPQQLRDQVARAAAGVPGVEKVNQVRLRRSGPDFFADVTLSVGHATSFEKAHEISDQAADAIRTVLPQADVVVHAEPFTSGQEDLTTTVRTLAARLGLGAHGIRLYEQDRQRWLELHLEVNESLSLEEAHRQASAFESDLRARVPELDRIVTHLEPAGDSTSILRAEPAA